MACKQGIRKNLEEARAFYKRMEAYDPVRALWRSLVDRSSDDPGLIGWSEPERTYFSVNLLEGEVYNGGFDQYFTNSSADSYRYAVAGLAEIGAVRSLGIVREAADLLFGKDGPPATKEGRWRIMRSSARRLSEVVSRHRRAGRLEQLDQAFWDDADRIGERLTDHADRHGLLKPFERPRD